METLSILLARQRIPRTLRLYSTGVLCVTSLLYVVIRAGLSESDLWLAFATGNLIVAYLCWRGTKLGFTLALPLAYLALFSDTVFFLLNVLGFLDPATTITSQIAFGLLQLPLAYSALKAYRGQLRWPILLIGVGSLFVLSDYIQNSAASYLAPINNISNPRITTLSEILSGSFPSSVDRYGTNGIIVKLANVTVVQIFGALDGDWHIVIRDKDVQRFITEMLPRDQPRLHAPGVGQQITMTGVIFWDSGHFNEAWHAYTGWEIHPVLAWSTI